MCLTIACSNEDVKLVDIEYDLTENNDNTLKNSTTFYDGAIQWLTEKYKYANRTSPLNGADDCPSTITNIIDNQEDFDKAFNEFPTEIPHCFSKSAILLSRVLSHSSPISPADFARLTTNGGI